MDDMISRAAAIEALSTPCDKRYRHGVWETCLDNIETAIRNIPAVDAAPVVRCRDCRFAKVENNYGFDEVICYNEEFGPRCPVPLDWFCADGERRDEE